MTYKVTRNHENQQKMMVEGVGKYDIPEILPVLDVDSCKFISFNERNSGNATQNQEELGVHFFLDDYQFQRIWTHPDKYMSTLGKFKYVMSPDFSLFEDYPRCLQLYNHFRKHWIGRYMQEQGITVIPTICWSDEKSFDWCFDGEPKYSWVAVSSVGCLRSLQDKNRFLAGYHEMMKRLHPVGILFYGTVPIECEGNIVRLPAYQEKFR